MDDQRSWQERYGVADLEAHHWCALIGIAFVLASPFFALARAEAGLMALGVGMLVFFLSAEAAGDPPSDDEK